MSCIVHAGGSVNVWNSEDRTALEFDDLREAIRARVELRTSGFCAVFCKSRLCTSGRISGNIAKDIVEITARQRHLGKSECTDYLFLRVKICVP